MSKAYKKKRFYKTSNKPKEEERSNIGKSGYENEDRTYFWGPEYIWKN